MARLGPPIILAKCGCGKILVKDYLHTTPYWTESSLIIENFKSINDLREEGCPEHGGDVTIMINGFFCRKYYEQNGFAIGLL